MKKACKITALLSGAAALVLFLFILISMIAGLSQPQAGTGIIGGADLPTVGLLLSTVIQSGTGMVFQISLLAFAVSFALCAFIRKQK